LEAPDKPGSAIAITDAPKHRAFSTAELVQCGACSRANPPTRAKCLYCGTALQVTGLNAFSPTASENTDASCDVASHLVVLAPAPLDEAAVNEISGHLKLKPSDLRSLLTYSKGAPVFVSSSEEQVRIAATKLQAQGVNSLVVSDEQLALSGAPKPISALKIHSDKLVGSVGRSAQSVEQLWSGVAVIVIGRLFFASKEIDQKQNRAQQVIDDREMWTDEAVADIYFASDALGWRIRAGSFDFSCLADRKKLTAFANFTELCGLLQKHASTAAFDDSYLHVRGALNSVWPPAPTRTAKESRRGGFRAFESSVTFIDNEIQFTRYSRLLHYLYSAKLLERHGAQT
jgi:hypothetical protein